MFRAKRLFEKQGIEVIPCKVDFKTGGDSPVILMGFLPSSNNIGLSEIGISEIFGRVFYFFKFYLSIINLKQKLHK